LESNKITLGRRGGFFTLIVLTILLAVSLILPRLFLSSSPDKPIVSLGNINAYCSLNNQTLYLNITNNYNDEIKLLRIKRCGEVIELNGTIIKPGESKYIVTRDVCINRMSNYLYLYYMFKDRVSYRLVYVYVYNSDGVDRNR